MKKNTNPTDDASAGMNPKNRDFQRIDGDVDNVSASEKNESLKYEKSEASMNPKNRDFQRKEDEVDMVSASERKSKQKDEERKSEQKQKTETRESGREHSAHKNNPQPNHGGKSHSHDTGKRH